MIGPKKFFTVKGVEVKVSFPEAPPPEIGKLTPINIEVRSKEPFPIEYVLFELINQRTDKRAPLDRVTSQSRYFYRFNINHVLSVNKTDALTFKIRLPIHKEPTKNDRFICIKWQISSRLALRRPESNKEVLFSDSPPLELEVI